MWVLLSDDFNGCFFKQWHVKHLLLRKTDVLENFLERKFEEMH